MIFSGSYLAVKSFLYLVWVLKDTSLSDHHVSSLLHLLPDFFPISQVICHLHWFVRTTITKYCRLSGLNKRNCLIVLDLVSPEAFFLGLKMSSHDLFSVCIHPHCLSVCLNLFFLKGHKSDWVTAHLNALILT